MEQWQVGPVPEYVYSNSTHQPNAMHNYQATDMSARRNERIDFNYPPQQGMPTHQQPHPPVQPSMNAPPQQGQPQQPQQQQQASSGTASQQQTPTPTPQPPRQRKRPAPNAAPSPATPVAVPAVTSGQASATTPSNVQSAVPPGGPPSAEDNSGTPSQPPTKKSRTNTPWSAEEEQRLKVLRDAGKCWAEIAKTFPSRTEGSVKKHWYKDMHWADFADADLQKLKIACKEYKANMWKVIGQQVGKPPKACEQVAKENFPELIASTKS